MANQDLINATKKRTLLSPLRSYLWRMELPSLDSRTYSSGLTQDEQFEVSSRILNANVPYNVAETDKANHGNSFWYFAKSTDIGPITLEVMEYADGLTYKYFSSWQKMISNNNGTFNPPAFYKKQVKFYRLDTNKEDVLLDVYSGYFVSGVGESTNDYETNNIIKLTITLTGDSVARKRIFVSGGEEGFQTIINKSKSLKTSLIQFLY